MCQLTRMEFTLVTFKGLTDKKSIKKFGHGPWPKIYVYTIKYAKMFMS